MGRAIRATHGSPNVSFPRPPFEHPRFLRIESFSPRNHMHVFRIDRVEDFDREFPAWMREAYRVGQQKHLR